MTREQYLAPCDVNDIRQVETTFARECLGEELYKSLVDGLADYSAATEWSGGTVAANTVKLYKGVYYKAKVNTTNEPTLKSDWELAQKFTAQANNDLWCNVLGRHLALLVLQSTLAPVSTPTTGMGNVKRKGTGFDAATESESLRKYHWVSAQLLGSWDNLEAYLKANGFNYLTCTASTDCCTVDGYYLNFNNGQISVSSEERTECTCGKCRQKAITGTNRYVVA